MPGGRPSPPPGGRIRRSTGPTAPIGGGSHGGNIEQVGGDSREADAPDHRLGRPPHRGDAGALRLHPRRGRRADAGAVQGPGRAALDAGIARPATRRADDREHVVARPHQERPRPRHGDDPPPPRRAPRRARSGLLRALSLDGAALPEPRRRGAPPRLLSGVQQVRRRNVRPLRAADDSRGADPDAHARGGDRGAGVRLAGAWPEGGRDGGLRPPPHQEAAA